MQEVEQSPQVIFHREQKAGAGHRPQPVPDGVRPPDLRRRQPPRPPRPRLLLDDGRHAEDGSEEQPEAGAPRPLQLPGLLLGHAPGASLSSSCHVDCT